MTYVYRLEKQKTKQKQQKKKTWYNTAATIIQRLSERQQSNISWAKFYYGCMVIQNTLQKHHPAQPNSHNNSRSTSTKPQSHMHLFKKRHMRLQFSKHTSRTAMRPQSNKTALPQSVSYKHTWASAYWLCSTSYIIFTSSSLDKALVVKYSSIEVLLPPCGWSHLI